MNADEISTQDPEEMNHDELRKQWQEMYERLISPPGDQELRNALWDRRKALWSEMKSRVDAEAPECPECGAQNWSQAMGEPKVCGV